jgi:hypothetical protein
MRVGRPARLAWSLAGACVALVLSSLALLLAVSHAGDVSQYYYEDAAVAVAFCAAGRRRGRPPLGKPDRMAVPGYRAQRRPRCGQQ